MKRVLALVLLVLLFSTALGSAQQPSGPQPKPFAPSSNFMSAAGFRKAALADLAPRGQLRVAIAPNPLIVTLDRGSGQLHGVAADMARELAGALGVPFAPLDLFNALPAAALARLVNGATNGEWDVAFTVSETQRLSVMDFSPAYMEIENSYMVRPGVAIRTIDEVDKPGVRVSLVLGTASDRFLSTALRNAQLVRTDTREQAFEVLRSGGAEVMATSRPNLVVFAERLPGSRILDGRFLVENQAIALPKGRVVGLAYVTAFVEWAKATGVVARAIERSGIRGLRVAPPAPSR